MCWRKASVSLLTAASQRRSPTSPRFRRCNPPLDGHATRWKRRYERWLSPCPSIAPTSSPTTASNSETDRDMTLRAQELARSRPHADQSLFDAAWDASRWTPPAKQRDGVRARAPAIHRAGDGQRRRGHRLLPVQQAPRLERGRRQPGHLGTSLDAFSWPRPATPTAGRGPCSRSPRTTRSAAPTCAAHRCALGDAGRMGCRGAIVDGAPRDRCASMARTLTTTTCCTRPWSAPGPSRRSGADFMLKAMREAKRHTSWTSRTRSTRAALGAFVERTSSPTTAFALSATPSSRTLAWPVANRSRWRRPSSCSPRPGCPTSTRAPSCGT